MEMVNIKINGMPLSVPAGSTILEAARMHGIEIPTLCYLREINEIGACRICVVEVVGMRNLVAACVYPVAEGMEILTNSKRVFASRKTNLELILSTVPACPAYATETVSCRNCVKTSVSTTKRFMTVKSPPAITTIPPYIWYATTPSVCCAAAVLPLAPNGRMLR